MLTSVSRRVVIVSAAAGLVVSAVALGAGPVGASGGHAAAPAATSSTQASLSFVSVAPHSTTAWALGAQTVSRGTSFKFSNYAVRSTGASWSRIGVKTPSGGSFVGIAASSPGSAWLAGTFTTTVTKPLIEHSTGGTFKFVHTNLPPGSLTAIAASSPSNIWVLETASDGTSVAEHGNGHHFTSVKFGGSHATTSMQAISVSSPSNVWILGSPPSGGTTAAHWNGHKFSFSTVPAPSGSFPRLIATSSGKSTWVAGTVSTAQGKSHILILYWNGHKWAKQSAATPGPFPSPGGISATGSQAFLVGSYSPPSRKGLNEHAFALRLAHRHWRKAHVAKQGITSGFIAIGESAKRTVAVGSSYNGYICGPHSAHVKQSPLAESAHRSAFGRERVPKLRRYSTARMQYGSAVPDIPSC